MTAPRTACGGSAILPARRTRLCLVCHGYIAEGQGMGIGHVRVMVHKEDCAGVVRELGRIYDQSPRGHWRPPSIVRGLVDGARCEACKAVSE